MSGAFGSLLAHKMAMPPASISASQSEQRQSAIPSDYLGYMPSALKFGGNPKKQTSDIGISYTPSSAPPKERLAADTGAQPLSLKTKSLIDLQTFDGCFILNSALASLLGVSISSLEARLASDNNHAGLSPELRKKIWATVLAIKLFETQLVRERSVWQLVVDKARAWMVAAGVGVEDITRLEKMAGEALGV